MKEFTKVIEAVKKESAQKLKDDLFYIEYGFCESWHESEKYESDNGIRRASTPARWEAYNAGKISRDAIIAYCYKRKEKERAKELDSTLEKISKAGSAADASEIYINVSWKKSAVWGYNPTVEARIGGRIYTGSASGCGYDKESAAIADALNDAPEIQKLLYTVKEKAAKTKTNAEIFGYGIGYTTLPYFEGGCGVDCIINIFKKCGFILECSNSSEHNNFYYLKKK